MSIPTSPPQTPLPAITQPGVTDEFIGHILPRWLKTASVAQINALREDFSRHRQSLQAVHATLDELSAIDGFAKHLFAQALQDRFQFAASIDHSLWRELRRDFKPSQGIGLPDDEPIVVRQPLLQRLLQGFSAREATAGSFYLGTGIIADTQPETLLIDAPDQVASVCRTLDVGKQFQDHLDQVFTPAQEDLAEEKRQGLMLAARLALLQAQIDSATYDMFAQLASSASQVTLDGLEVRPCHLFALGCQVDTAVVFELRGKPPEGALRWTDASLIRALIVYLPNDPLQALRRYSSWFAFNRALVQLLKDEPGYQRYFSKLIGLQQRPDFASLLTTRLADSSVDLVLHGTILRGELFSALCQLQLVRIKADARLLAVPTADVDSAAVLAWRAGLRSTAWAGLNLVGLFVPAVGGLLLGHLLVQALGEVFEGAEDWLRGHQGEALEHMLGVAETVAVTVALGAGIHVLARGFRRSDFIQSLLPVTLANGQPRLWQNELRPYRLPQIPDAAGLADNGLQVAGEHRYLALRNKVYEVRQEPKQGGWRLVHQRRPHAYGPAVEFNGERAWRLRDERPLEWQGEPHLLERLWPAARLFDTNEVSAILHVAAIDEAELRGLLVENRRMPVGLRDTLERFAEDRRITRFIEQLNGTAPLAQLDAELYQYALTHLGLAGPADARAQLQVSAPWLRVALFEHFSTRYLPSEPLVAVIQRDFPSLPTAYCLALLEQADDDQRALLANEARMPLALAEQARALTRAARLIRAREGLYLGSAGSLDSAHLVFYALRHLPTWPQELNLALHDGLPYSRLVDHLQAQDSPAELRTLVHQQGVYRLYGNQGGALGHVQFSGNLLEAIAEALSQAQRERLGWYGLAGAMRMGADVRAQLSASNRDLESIIGLAPTKPWFNPGYRLSDGRVGYLLSGREAGQALAQNVTDRLCALFPGFDAQQRSDFVASLRASGVPVLFELLRLEQEYQVLDQALQDWEAGAPAQASSSGVTLYSAHNRVANALRRCWRRQSELLLDAHGAFRGYRLSLVGLHIPTFPNLPNEVSFSHVVDVVMVGMRMRRLPASFFRAFAATRWLNLSNNLFDELPSGLGQMSGLRILRLGHNYIRLQPADVDALGTLNQLRMLVLDENPLRRNLNLRPLHRLREVSLRNTGLQALPHGLLSRAFLEQADLRNNRISTLPERFFSAPGALRDCIYLQGNPLPQATWQRLTELEGVQAAGQVLGEHVDARALWLAGWDEREYETRAAQWDALLQETDSAGFFLLLRDLTGTADYRLTREDLNLRVWQLLEAAQGDTALREELFAFASAPRTCVDSVADCFSALEVRYLLWHARHQQSELPEASRLLAMARRLFRLERVEQIARQDMRARDDLGVDEVEVSLAYRVGLALELELPGQPRALQFAEVAQVSRQQLEAAARAVRVAEASEQLLDFVVTRDFWLGYLRDTHSQAFADVEEPFVDQVQALADLPQVNEDALDALAVERAIKVRELVLELTGPLLAALPGE
ncbi:MULTISPECIES: NEL-type E3 ubiquitin ligase domain-containing protein [Pseudomonas]|uniref:RING-type E3 ubiquitin transferase n=1 Tax=Pseudomonas fluorescens TaxID=294 RepID=A0AAN2HDM7_PSEFL|nr:NEL-type E3 ubiquitin ligase domain-containing protein [Pseudomonas sp. Irchel 3F5]